eukprot:CAMPEP_0179339696 /NCGR_PEP_ID=MMETSP0797-20121207/68860_1 /TAXON_ID=47934 /ORGANISM="Dinophysis acuminata, Strain DAEP01" /LENGTH=98 /DNA_ID=CAMNT_0021053559 /DNA_START=51 /DNA_END=344 /DNA_ORIENTATION=+
MSSYESSTGCGLAVAKLSNQTRRLIGALQDAETAKEKLTSDLKSRSHCESIELERAKLREDNAKILAEYHKVLDEKNKIYEPCKALQEGKEKLDRTLG